MRSMKLNDLMQVIVMVVILQISLGVIIYGVIGMAPEADVLSIITIIAVLITVSTSIAVVLYWVTRRYTTERALKVALMTLSGSEREVLEIVMQEGKIRQDDLFRKVDMSRSKLAALINNLAQKRAITKTPYQKTNILEPTPEFRR